MSTIALVASERGYAATRVRDVIEPTGISRRTFYVYFDNLEDCFFAAYDAIVADLLGLVARPASDGTAAELAPTLERVLTHFAAWPDHARVLLNEVQSAGPPGTDRYELTMATLAARLSSCRTWQPAPCQRLERLQLAQAALGAMARLVQLRLHNGDGRALPELAPSLTSVALAA